MEQWKIPRAWFGSIPKHASEAYFSVQPSYPSPECALQDAESGTPRTVTINVRTPLRDQNARLFPETALPPKIHGIQVLENMTMRRFSTLSLLGALISLARVTQASHDEDVDYAAMILGQLDGWLAEPFCLDYVGSRAPVSTRTMVDPIIVTATVPPSTCAGPVTPSPCPPEQVRTYIFAPK